jgi:thiamine biosynthesis protein ThiS
MIDPMKLTVNGEDREFSSGVTVASLLVELGLKSDRVAVELNRDLLPRDRWNATPLNDNDKLEIVHFVGGGC